MRRTSVVWTIDGNRFREIVSKSNTFSDILRKLDIGVQGGNIKTLKKRLLEDKIDFSHIYAHNGKRYSAKPFPLNEVMIKNSTYSRASLKRQILKKELLKNECSICEQKAEWNEKSLIMVLDHINGVNNDHRLKNLRFVCPNCNSQLSTFCGKHNKKRIKEKKGCKDCGKEIGEKSTLCVKCANGKTGKKIRKVKNRPSKEEIQEMLKTMSYCSIGRKYGVSDNAVRKWLKFGQVV